MEQTAYDALKRQWNELDDGMRDYCIDVAKFGGKGSYSTLQGCVQMEQQAEGENQGFKFRY